MISFEPDDFAPGTNVSNVNPFVSLSTFTSSRDTSFVPTISPVYITEDLNCLVSQAYCSAVTGTNVFQDGFGRHISWGALGAGIGNATGCFRDIGLGESSPDCDERFNVMLMTFTGPTDFVEISGGFYAEDETHLYGFDDSFNPVGLRQTIGDFERCRGENAYSDYCQVTVSLTAPASNMRYVIAGGWSNGTSLDNLRFSVPEPASITLFGLGLIGIIATRRKHRHAAG